ncbi:MAG: GNAT family N-acetyltransferase [Actinomycetota bacterium]|nr:GNAT family N-acetyltransferase [Actinomycetota bacterium]
MGKHGDIEVRIGTAADAPLLGRVLHEFNLEFGSDEPSADEVTGLARPQLESGEIAVLFAGDGPAGFAQLRFRGSLYDSAPAVCLEELYVEPGQRGHGFGWALLDAAMDYARGRGATHIDLNTSVDDTSARALYERNGFTNREGDEDGPTMLYYERDL